MSEANNGPCQTCLGEGEVDAPFDMDEYGHINYYEITCPRCKGSGIDPRTEEERQADYEGACRIEAENRRKIKFREATP